MYTWMVKYVLKISYRHPLYGLQEFKSKETNKNTKNLLQD